MKDCCGFSASPKDEINIYLNKRDDEWTAYLKYVLEPLEKLDGFDMIRMGRITDAIQQTLTRAKE